MTSIAQWSEPTGQSYNDRWLRSDFGQSNGFSGTIRWGNWRGITIPDPEEPTAGNFAARFIKPTGLHIPSGIPVYAARNTDTTAVDPDGNVRYLPYTGATGALTIWGFLAHDVRLSPEQTLALNDNTLINIAVIFAGVIRKSGLPVGYSQLAALTRPILKNSPNGIFVMEPEPTNV